MQAQPDSLVSPGTETYLQQFEQLRGELPGQDVPWLDELRQSSMNRFSSMGFPSQRDEDWKYTSLRGITSKSFGQAVAAKSPVATADLVVPGLDSYRLVFVDGILEQMDKAAFDLPNGLEINTISSVLAKTPESLQPYLGRAIGESINGFISLNSALYRDGVVVSLEPDVELDKPLELVFVSSSDLSLAQPRNLVIAGENSRAKIIERYLSQGDESTLSNSVTEIFLSAAAEIDYYVVQTLSRSAYQVCGIWVSQAQRSRFSCRTVTLGGGLVRNDLRSEMHGPQAHCDMLGLYSLSGKQHVDNHTTMIHGAESCTSNELYKGVLDQRSRAVFHGRIKVRQGAQKTDAHQTNNTLLLSRDAEIDTKPQLEIYADDVKCSHGATIGQLDENSLFYLRSRGLDADSARSMLTYAFVNDVLDEIDIEPLRQYLEGILGKQLIRGTQSVDLDIQP
jgi:Fe-S cluster assembly protein SufD